MESYKSTFTHFDSTGYLKPPSIAVRKIDRKETYILLNISLMSQLEYTRSYMHDYTSDIICLADPDCEVFKVETEGNIKQVHIRSRKQAAYCSCCGRRMRSKGWHVRQVNHQILNGWLKSVLIVHQRKWHCPACGIYV